MFVMAQIKAELNEIDEEAMLRQTTGGDDDDNDGNNNNNDDNNNNGIEHNALNSTQEVISPSPSVPQIDSGLSSGQGSKIFGVSILQSQQPPVTLGSLESLGLTFQNFHAKLSAWINQTFPMYGCPFVPGLSCITLQVNDKASFASGLICSLLVF